MSEELTWRGFKFVLPEGLEDESILTFVRRDAAPVSATVVVEELGKGKEAFDAYVDKQVSTVMAALPKCKLVEKKNSAAGKLPAVSVEISAPDEQGDLLHQFQVYARGGQKVLVATVTAGKAQRAEAEAMMQQMVKDLQTT